jgi:hypothetical protein
MTNKYDKHEKFIKKVLIKMFSMVGAKYSKEFYNQHEWYLKYSFDDEQLEKFKIFFIESAKKDLKLSNRRAESEFNWFNLCFGWKQKNK